MHGRASTNWKPKNIDCRSTLGLYDLNRGIAKSENKGFIKLLTKPSTNEIPGVTITEADARTHIPQLMLAKKMAKSRQISNQLSNLTRKGRGNKYAAGE